MQRHFDNQSVDKKKANKFGEFLTNHPVNEVDDCLTCSLNAGIKEKDFPAYIKKLARKVYYFTEADEKLIEGLTCQLEMAAMAANGDEEVVIKGRMNVTNFDSFYAFMLVTRSEDGTYNCFCCAYTLSFEYDELKGITLAEANACKDEYMLIACLKKMKNQNFIKTINDDVDEN